MKPLCCVTVTVLSLASLASLGQAAPVAAPGYEITELVAGSPFCGVHGLGIDSEDRLYAGSVVGQRIYSIDTDTGAVTTEVEAPRGLADDMEFLPDGTLVWTSISHNAVRARRPNGEIVDLATGLASVNSIAYRESDNRLFVAQVFGGDGLWELDPAGEKPRRNILEDIGGLNGFDIGPDGMIYGPLWFKQQVVRIDPDSGELQLVADGFHTPAAANFDSEWNLYVLDTATGEVFLIDIQTGEKKVFVRLKTSLDNLAIDSRDRIYVSNMADNAIHRIDAETGEVNEVVKGGLSCPMSLSAAGNSLYLADVFALRAIDATTGNITDINRAHAAGTHIGYPTAVAASATRLYAISAEGLHVYDRNEYRLLDSWRGMRGLQQVMELDNGDLLALSGGGTRLTRLAKDNFNEQQVVVAENMDNIGGMVSADGNTVYFTLPSANSVVRIDLASGERQSITDQLDRPRGIDFAPEGELIVMEGGGRIVKLLMDDTVKIETIADNIPVGRLNPRAGILSPGLAVTEDGTIHALSDSENTLYRITQPGSH
ncbi:MAG: SMP-30/gluconolactonase/LRE family protein [Cellvibrionaceae bacterium]